MSSPIPNPKNQRPYSATMPNKPTRKPDEAAPIAQSGTGWKALADVARSQGYSGIDHGNNGDGPPVGGMRDGKYVPFTGGKTPDTLTAEGQSADQQRQAVIGDARKRGILNAQVNAQNQIIGGVNAKTGSTLTANVNGELEDDGHPNPELLKKLANTPAAAPAPAQTHTDEQQAWNTSFGHIPGTASNPTPYQQPPLIPLPVRTDSGAGVGGTGLPHDVAVQRAQDQSAAATPAPIFPRAPQFADRYASDGNYNTAQATQDFRQGHISAAQLDEVNSAAASASGGTQAGPTDASRAMMNGRMTPQQQQQLSSEAQTAASTAYDRAHPGETAAHNYGKIGQSAEPTHVIQPGETFMFGGKQIPEGSSVTFGPKGPIIQPPAAPVVPTPETHPAIFAPATTATNPALAANPTLPDSVKGESTTKFPSVSPSGTFRPGTFNGAPKTVGLDTGVNVPAVSDPGTSGVPGFKAPSLGSTPFPTLSTTDSFAGPTTADGQAIVAGQPAPAPVPQPSPAPTTAAESGLAARKAVGDAFNSAGGALDRGSASAGNAVSSAIDATTSFVTGSPKSATAGVNGYAPDTGEPSDMYPSTAPRPATPGDAATQRLLSGDARGGMGTTAPAGGYNQATQDAQVDSTVALNSTGQRGTLPSTAPGAPAASSTPASAVAATTPRSFGASTTYVPPPTDEAVNRAMNGGTTPTSTTPIPKPTIPTPDQLAGQVRSALGGLSMGMAFPTAPTSASTTAADTLAKAPGYGADPGTYSATPASASSARSPDGSNASPDGSARSPDGTNASPDGTARSTSADSALSSAPSVASLLGTVPGYSPTPDVTNKPPGDNASTAGNAVYQPKTQPTGNAVYNPDSAANGNALYQPPTPAVPKPDDDEEQKRKAAAAAFIGI